MLRTVAQALRSTSRRGDTLYRYGGEEFIVVLPELTADTAPLVAQRLRRSVEALAIPHADNPPGWVTPTRGHARPVAVPPRRRRPHRRLRRGRLSLLVA